MKGVAVTGLLVLGIVFGGSTIALAGSVGFVDTGGVFTTFNAPYGSIAEAYGINNSGQIVGYVLPGQAFVDTGGVFTTFYVPGTVFYVPGTVGDYGTYPRGINNSGQIVGFSANPALQVFVDTAGVFTTLNVPGVVLTQADGINDDGQIVGNVPNAHGTETGFVYSDGGFTTFSVPGASGTWATGINNSGQIVGYIQSPFSSSSPVYQAFVDTAGVFTTLNVPGAIYTQAYGINNSGQIVGIFRGPDDSDSGFVYSEGGFTTFDVPGAVETDAYGINDSGQIVGTAVINDSNPGIPGSPEPSYLIPLCFGMVALALVLRRRSRSKRQSGLSAR